MHLKELPPTTKSSHLIQFLRQLYENRSYLIDTIWQKRQDIYADIYAYHTLISIPFFQL